MLKRKKKNADVPSILYQRNAGEKIVFGIAATLLILYCISLLFPLFWLVINSLKGANEYDRHMLGNLILAFPTEWKFSNYIQAFTKLKVTMGGETTNFFGMLWNSIWMVFSTSIISVFTHAVTGYIFAKYKFKGKKVMYFLVIVSLTIPIVGTAAAGMKLSVGLRLYNNPLGRIVDGLGGFGANFLIMMAIFSSVPWSYAEAVFIDGGNDFTVFFKIMLPQAMPAMLTLLITAVIQRWKEYENVLMYYPSYPNLNSGLYMMKADTYLDGEPLYLAGLVISTLPVVLMYAFSSEAMMKNLSVGGLKG